MARPDLPTAIMNLINHWRTNVIGFAMLGLTKLYADEIEGNSTKDLTFKNATGKDFIKSFSDKVGGRKELFKNSDGDTVASIDSLGVGTFSKINAPIPSASGDINGAPTNAECVTAFGAAAIGKVGEYVDIHEGGKTYLCVANASAWVTFEGAAAA